MIYKYLTHPLYCHMTLTKGEFKEWDFGPDLQFQTSPLGAWGGLYLQFATF